MSRKGHLTLISLLGKGLYQRTTKETNDNKEEGSGLGDVGHKVFADDDVVKEGDIVIKQFHTGRKNRFGTDFDIFLDSPHFLGHIRKGWANFLIDN